MKKGLLTFSYIMFGLTALITLAVLALTVFAFATVRPIIPPMVISFVLLPTPFVPLTLHYHKSIKMLKNPARYELRKLNGKKVLNFVLMGIFAYLAFGFLWMLLYAFVLSEGALANESFFVPFVCVLVLLILYTVNLLLIAIEFGKIAKHRSQSETGENTKMPLRHYTLESKGELANIVDDCITYNVLRKILSYRCTDIFTNGQSIIICYTNAPYPIWIWCKKPFDSQDVAVIADTLKTHYLEKGQYKFTISEDLLAELIKVDDVFGSLVVKMQLLSYELVEINQIDRKCDGQMQKATMEQADQLALMYKDACLEMEGFDFPLEQCKNKVTELIQNGDLHIWTNDNNEIVATASKGVDGKYAKIAFVYTLPNHRRKGYAINLVHGLSKMLMDNDLTPILYADGQYVASNACYQKIGYKQVGKLVEVGN